MPTSLAALAPEVMVSLSVGARRAAVVAVVMGTIAGARPAWAQSTDAGTLAADGGSVGASTDAAATGSASSDDAGVVASSPTEPVAQARMHFDQGAALFTANNYEAALVEFQRAYELLDGNANQYTVLFNIGQCQERLFRYDEAMRAYQRYLHEGGERADDRVQVEATVRALEGLLGEISVRINVPAAEIWVDDRRVGSAPGSIHVAGGRHTVEVRAPGFLPARQEVSVPARERREVTLELQTVRDTFGVSPVFFAGSLGIAVVCAGVGAAFGVQALNAYNDLSARANDPVQQYTVQASESDAIHRNANIADAFFGGAALFAVAAGTLFFFTDFKGERTDANAPGTTTSTQATTHARRGPSVRVMPFGLGGAQIIGVF